MTNRSPARRRAASLLLFAGLVFFVLSLFPLGQIIQWPFVILTTFIHELGHGLTAILVGGKFVQMELYADAAGLALMKLPAGDWRSALVSAGGLLAPSVFGGVLIVAGRSATSSSRVFLTLSMVILLSCVFWIRTVFGLAVMGGMGLAFLWLARKRSPGMHQFLIQFIGVHMLVDTVTRTFAYLFSSGVTVNGAVRHSDSSAIAHAVGGNHLVWGLLIAIIALSIFYYSLRRVYLR